jgi:hypothetical protein
VASEEFASHRAQIERLLELADEYELSGMDRDKLPHAADDKPVARFDDERARGLAKRLAASLKDAEPSSRPRRFAN